MSDTKPEVEVPEGEPSGKQLQVEDLVVGDGEEAVAGKRVEVQIRTREMHEVAEGGVAAHWSYRDGVRSENRFAVDPAEWLADMNRSFEEAKDHAEFLEAVKLEMYTD